jgi:ABC-2 type transport system ATP-binding protein
MLLQTDKLTKDYGRFRALENLSLTVQPGEVFGLLGPNGSGKSTALRIFLGFLRPTSGSAAIAGHDCWHDSVAARRQVAYLPGELRLYENMTCRQLIRFLCQMRGQSPNANGDGLARRFDLDLDRPIAHLSSGMKRKVALLQVLELHAPLLILDEPTNTLDPTMRDELLDQIRLARDQGQAVLFSSHVLSEVERVCDRVGILQRGRLVHVQELAQLRQARLLRLRFDTAAGDAAGPAASASAGPVPGMAGLSILERRGDQVTLEYHGPLRPLLEWLARQPLRDVQMEPMGLTPIYHRYHGAEA